MQISLIDTYAPTDYSDKSVLIPLSGGINSAAVLCYAAKYYPPKYKPRRLVLHHTEMPEHSPDTSQFVSDCVEYAKQNFENVSYDFNAASMLEFCLDNKMIPHPAVSPCSRLLKIEIASKIY